MHPSCWLKWTLALGLVLLVAGTGAPTASADTTLFYYDDVSTGGGGGAALAPVGYWTCHHTRYVTLFTNNTAQVVGSNGCNHNVQHMSGTVSLERPLGYVLSSASFDCPSCATRTAAATPWHVDPGNYYFYRYNTTIELPYGNLWDTYPSWCTAYVDRLVCSSVISFYVPAQGGPS